MGDTNCADTCVSYNNVYETSASSFVINNNKLSECRVKDVKEYVPLSTVWDLMEITVELNAMSV